MIHNLNTTPISSLKDLKAIKKRILDAQQHAKGGQRERIRVCMGGGCLSSGSRSIVKALEKNLSERGILNTVEIVECGCMGPCSGGPVMAFERDDCFYHSLKAEDVEEIVERHILKHQPVERLMWKRATDGEVQRNEGSIDFFKGQDKIVLRNCGRIRPTSIEDYISVDGFLALEKVLREANPEGVITTVEEAGLRGRGGAGFPTSMKWHFARMAQGDVKYILCNADEGDPGAFMDRSVLEGDPYSVIEGMIIGAYVIGAHQGYVYVRAEYPLAVERLMWKRATDGEVQRNEGSIDFFKGQDKIVLRNCGRIRPTSIEDYISVDGFLALEKVLREANPEGVITTVEEAGLRGRGGAGFPTSMKWHFARMAQGDVKYILCNADEGDPGAFMDRSVLEGDPYSVIEGMIIGAYVIGAHQGYVYVRAEYPLAVERLQAAIDCARLRGLLGADILGSGFSFDLEIRMGSGAFVCGEETALIESIEGKRGEPRPRPPFPVHKGLWGAPTVLNNVETFANIPAILLNGSAWYAARGTEESKGTKVFALAGSIRNSGLVEVPIGTPLGELIYDIGGGTKGDRPFKAAQIGGPSGGCIPRQHLNTPLDYKALQELGAIMGSGGLIVMDEDTCMVDVARFFLEFVQEESCGKCVPCRVGTKRMLEILERICAGEGRPGDIEKLEELGSQIKDTSLCGLGQSAPNPVLSTIRYFREEYEEHIHQKFCRSGVCAALVRAPCQCACPANVDVPGFVSLTGEKRYAEALRLHRNRNPFAAICARVCFHTCESMCRRASLDEAVSIRGIKRFMVDQEVIVQLPEARENAANARRKIAIVGGGPAGLSCAYFLARLGYRPEVFEAEPRPGGMLVQTIPAYRLPRETVAKEIRMIEQLGVDIRTQQRLGTDFTLQSLRDDGYDAVFIGIGIPGGLKVELPGGDGPGVVDGITFLKEYNLRGSVRVGKKVVIVGGGNCATDAARTAIRLGAEVSMVYRRSQEEMPAYKEEIAEALQEGVTIHTLTNPVRIIRDGETIVAVECSKMSLGDFDRSGRRSPVESERHMRIEADQVIYAIGQSFDFSGICDAVGLETVDNKQIRADKRTCATNLPWVFAAGDSVTGPQSVIDAVAGGERAAVSIDKFLTGEEHAFWREEQPNTTAYDPDADPVPYPREGVVTLPTDRRRHNFDEVELPWTEGVAVRQAKRCLRCDYGK